MALENRDPLPDVLAPDEADLIDRELGAEDAEPTPPSPEEYLPSEPRPFEANPADVAEQLVEVPLDDDDHERG